MYPYRLNAAPFVLSMEAQLEQAYVDAIEPFWQAEVKTHKFEDDTGMTIHTAWVIHPRSKGSIVISSGRTEGSIKYKEVFFDLYRNGYSVFTLDHRGQGQSGRVAHNPDKGYVADYQLFVANLHTFIENTVRPNSPRQPNLLCHSMGCAIGAMYLHTYPDTFAKAVFSSPMFAIQSPIPAWLAEGLIGVHGFLNQVFSDQPWYFPGQGDKQPIVFAHNVVTHSPMRYRIAQREFDQLDVALGGVTTAWLSSSLRAMAFIEQNAVNITTPALLLQSGGDTVVDNNVQNQVCTAMPDCKLMTVADAKHELLLEQDQYRVPAMTALLLFFQSD